MKKIFSFIKWPQRLKSPMSIMLLSLGTLAFLVISFHLIKSSLISHFIKQNASNPIQVSTTKVKKKEWQHQIESVGRLRSLNNANITPQVAGMITNVKFVSGQQVKEGDTLVEFNIEEDIAKLNSLKADAELSQITYDRDKAQYAIKGVSKATLDAAFADLKSKQALVAQQEAYIKMKKITAPFSGRIGVTTINAGEYLNPGDTVAILDANDPMLVDFYIPQKELSHVKIDQPIELTVDTYLNEIFKGKICALDTVVNPGSNNIKVTASVDNKDGKLFSGMAANIQIYTDQKQFYLTLPQTAITFNPYGSLVYLIKPSNTPKGSLIANQSFVITGEKRGTDVIILKGVKENDEVVLEGQVKLNNNAPVTINNTYTKSDIPSSPTHLTDQ